MGQLHEDTGMGCSLPVTNQANAEGAFGVSSAVPPGGKLEGAGAATAVSPPSAPFPDCLHLLNLHPVSLSRQSNQFWRIYREKNSHHSSWVKLFQSLHILQLTCINLPRSSRIKSVLPWPVFAFSLTRQHLTVNWETDRNGSWKSRTISKSTYRKFHGAQAEKKLHALSGKKCLLLMCQGSSKTTFDNNVRFTLWTKVLSSIIILLKIRDGLF